MLTPVSVERTPAANSRRFLLCTALVIAAAMVAGCSQTPPDPSEWDGIRTVLKKAIREVRATDPETATEIERLMAVAEVETARQNAASRLRRETGRTTVVWNSAVVAAGRALAAVRSERTAQDARLASLLARAEAHIEAAEGRIGLAGVDGRIAGETSSARYHATTARRLAGSGDFTTAIEHAEEALVVAAGLDHSWSKSVERFSDPTLLALWREQAKETIDESRRTGRAVIIVDKLQRRLLVYEGGRERAVFAAELGGNGLERKLHTGDRATPEGRYRVSVKKGRGATKYYLALLIDYPNASDLRRYRAAETAGEVPRGTGAGNLIEIHGHGGSGRDWTDGCVALTDEDMDRLFAMVQVGTPVTIVGTL